MFMLLRNSLLCILHVARVHHVSLDMHSIQVVERRV